MLDVLMAIASDPTAWPLWGIFLFSAAAYPLGFMMGSSCSPCCGCALCAEGALPDTVTVTLSDMPDQTRSADLITLQFNACYGTGAFGRVLEPGGYPEEDTGPISEVLVIEGGSGYAKLGRVEPTITLTGSGTGTTFTPTLGLNYEPCSSASPGEFSDVPYWRVDSVSVSGTGAGYSDGEELVITLGEGDVEELAATIIVRTSRDEPELTAVVPVGKGADLTVNMQKKPFTTPDAWEVESVTVNNGGTGYTDGTLVEFSLGTGDVEIDPAYAEIWTGRAEPEVTLSLSMTSSGSGAQLSATLSKDQDFSGRDYWYVSKITVDSPGVGYENGESVFASTFDVENFPLFATVNTRNEEPDVTVQWQLGEGSTGSGALFGVTLSPTTDEEGKDVWVISAVTVISAGENFLETDILEVAVNSGTEIIPAEFEFELNETGGFASVTVTEGGRYAIVGLIDTVDISYGGEYFIDTGVIESVQIYWGGSYYKDDGIPVSAVVTNLGIYYREDPSEPPYVADVTVDVSQVDPYTGGVSSTASGAVISAVVDDNTGSANFGKVIALEIDDPGEGYFAWQWLNTKCCGEHYDDVSFVLRRNDTRNYRASFFEESGAAACIYSHRMCGVGNLLRNTGRVSIRYRGPSEPPLMFVTSESLTASSGDDGNVSRICNTVLIANRNVTNCNDWSDLVFQAQNGRNLRPTLALSLSLSGGSTGSGATLAVVLERKLIGVGNVGDVWEIASVNVVTPGENYIPGDGVLVTVSEGSELVPATLQLNLGAGGEVESVTVLTRGEYAIVGVGRTTATVEVGGEYDETFRNPGGTSCDICCKGEELMPDEIEVTVTDTRDIGHDYSGTYAITRTNIAQGIVFGGTGWFATFPGFSDPFADQPIPAIRIVLRLGTCSGQSPVGFDPEDWTMFGGGICDDCHNKCRLRANLTISDVGNLSSVFTATFFEDESQCSDEEGFVVDPCSICQETPICNPSGRSLVLCTSANTGGPSLECVCGGLTIDT